MKKIKTSFTLAVLLLLGCLACGKPNVHIGAEAPVSPPSQMMEFDVLYAQNCAGCHGSNGKGGAAISLADPVFLAIADDAVIRRTAATGVPGTPMPAFAQSAGGMLSDQQIDALVRGIRSWSKTKPDALEGAIAPSYAVSARGEPRRGADVYQTHCSSCHGSDGRGGKASSIVDGSYLALVSDQDLRTNVIVGRPELGAPDWRNDLPDKPMSDQEISDVVSWLADKRLTIPGQPYPGAITDRATGGIR